ncbi:MAG TPA: carboxypeptidase-like regulatory domain-containing protein [Vicinamibacterales bacterium]|nr:carboxypeptidase-like regulatory domain-containing protein [Vicinamibacterales bacterium]
MRSGVRYAVLVAVMTLVVPMVSSAQFRGLGRVTGTVADDAGAPIKDVYIRATLTGEEGVIEERTDEKGAWAVNGMAKGEWHLTFQTPGYMPVAAKVVLAAELGRVTPIAVVLKKVK